eukprot:1619048-Amphidinium_carterae.1
MLHRALDNDICCQCGSGCAARSGGSLWMFSHCGRRHHCVKLDVEVAKGTHCETSKTSSWGTLQSVVTKCSRCTASCVWSFQYCQELDVEAVHGARDVDNMQLLPEQSDPSASNAPSCAELVVGLQASSRVAVVCVDARRGGYTRQGGGDGEV